MNEQIGNGVVLVIGVFFGIGVIYVEYLVCCGYDLLLVVCDW